MPVEPVGPQSYGNTVESPTTTAGSASPSAAASGKGTALASDSIVSSEGTQAYVPVYVEPINRPQLPLPQDNKFSDPQAAATRGATGSPASPTTSVPVNSATVYENKLEQLVAQVAVKDPNLAEKVKFVLSHPNAQLEGADFKKAAGIAAKLQTQATEYVKSSTGDLSFEPPAPDTVAADQDLAATKGNIFDKVVNDNKTLSDQDKATLMLAHYHPEALPKESLSPQLQKLLKKYEAATEKMFDKLGVAPKNYEVTQQSSSFDIKQSIQFSNMFQQTIVLSPFALNPPIGEDDINYLQFKLNNPDGPPPPVPEGRTEAQMENLFTAILEQTQAAYTAQTGFPPNFAPAIQKEVFDSALLGNFEFAFDKQLESQSPPLTEAQKTLLKAALGTNPDNIPKEIQALFEMLKGAAIAEIIKAFDLPPSWTPQKTRDLTDPKVISQRAQVAEAMKAVAAGQELAAQMQTTVDQMPPGADQTSYSSYLKVVGAALNNLSMSLFASSATDSNISRTLSLGNADTQLNAIKIQQNKAEEARKKEEKAAKMQKVFGAFMGILMCIGALFMGPMVFAFTLALNVQKITTGTNFMEDLTTKIMDGISNLVHSPVLQAILKTIASYYVMMLTIIINPLGSIDTFTKLLGDRITDFLKAFGVPPKTAEMAGGFIAQGLVLVAEIVVAIVTFGAASELMVGSFASMMNMISKTVVQDITKAAQTFMKATEKVLEAASDAARATAKALQKTVKEADEIAAQLRELSSVADRAPTARKIADIEKLTQDLAAKLRKVEELAKDLATQLSSEGGGFANTSARAQRFAEQMSEKVKEMDTLAVRVTEAANSGTKQGQAFEKGFKYAMIGFAGVSASMSIVNGVVNVNREILLGQIERIKAEMAADMIEIRAIIRSIRMVIDNMLSGMSQTGTMIKGIQKQQQDKYTRPGFTFVV